MAAYTNEVESQSQMVFDKNLNFLHSQAVPGNYASWIVSQKSLEAAKLKSKNTLHPGMKAQMAQFRICQPSSTDHLQVPSRSLQPKELPRQAIAPPPSRFGVNGWQVQWGEGHANSQEGKHEPMEDALSENMDISSASEADDTANEGTSLHTMERHYAYRSTTPSRASGQPSNAIDSTLSDNMEISSGPEADDESDDLSSYQRTSSTPIKESGRSSHTSVDPFTDTKSSIGDTGAAIKGLKSPTPESGLSSQLSPAKSTTPAELKPPSETLKSIPRPRQTRLKRHRFADYRTRTSIPFDLPPTVLAQQGIHAAYSSRLNPFALHPDEYKLLRHHICHLHVSAYLNIRNRILRLWVRNPLVSVTAEEAAGCALASRWTGLAEVAYEWLIRKGYINFGCVEIPEPLNAKVRRYKLKRFKRKTIVVVGAGMSGLGCSRQLEGLFQHYRDRWTSVGEEPPNVVLLEGRNRIGGRVYSHPLNDQMTQGIPEQKRCTAEMGAHIVIGFDHGNPLSVIVRGQLALHYHPLDANTTTLHDTDGKLVDQNRDIMVEKLYNDILDRASVYRHRVAAPMTVEGDKKLIEAGRDPQREGGPPISEVEIENLDRLRTSDSSDTEAVPAGMDKLTGKAHLVTGSRKKDPPALAAEAMGWQLPPNVLAYSDLNLDVVAKVSKYPTLGAAMDEAVKQYQFLLDLSPQDMRLLNWHYANLEYANAANVGKLSLGGWDQDAGNEFEGKHAQVIGGYQQVPRGMLESPSKLDLHTRKVVKQLKYNPDSGSGTTGTKVICEDGDTFEADHIVLTAPLGVLKQNSIIFSPPLPEWKTGPIQRLGFGTLNKVILAYERPFWNVDQDMFGLLREPEVADSLDQEDYGSNRGRFYFFWNCVKTTGRPVLISLMAGDAAHQAEARTDVDLVAEVTRELSKIFKDSVVPDPLETIVTRWGKDRFARGSYSYVGASSQPGDYEAMAAPIGNLHFAGEATCATHPATVHGAYISGLRAAFEVIDDLLGPIEIPNPLVPWSAQADLTVSEPRPRGGGNAEHTTPSDTTPKSTDPNDGIPREPEDLKQVRLEAFEQEILQAIFDQLGLRPSHPGKPGSNPFLLFTKEKWTECRKYCDEVRFRATGNPYSKASKNELRSTLGSWWKSSPEEVKRPYIERAAVSRQENEENAATFNERLASWDARAIEVRREYVEQHPGVLSDAEVRTMWQELGLWGDFGDRGERRAKKMSGYAEDSDSNAEL